MQLLGDGYEISEMKKLHGLLRPSRFVQRSASSVDRRVGDGWPRSTPARASRSRDPAELRYWRSGAGPPLLGIWDTGGAWATRASVSSKSTHKSPLRQTHIGGMQAAPRGLAHMCGLLGGAHMRLVG